MKKIMLVTMVAILMLVLAVGASAEAAIAVTGAAEVRVQPDCASLHLGVTATGADVQMAMTRVNERVNAIREVLKAQGVALADIAVSDIYMHTNYNYEAAQTNADGTQPVSTYFVSHQISITVRDTAQVGTLIDLALGAGANQLNGVSFFVSDSTEAYAQALALAVKNARAHAEVMAAAEGLTLSGLTSLSEGRETYSPVAKAQAEMDSATGATQVDVGGATISAAVTAVFEAN